MLKRLFPFGLGNEIRFWFIRTFKTSFPTREEAEKHLKKGAKIMSRFFDYGTNCEYCKHSDTELWDKPCNICDGAVNFEEEEDDNNVTQ